MSLDCIAVMLSVAFAAQAAKAGAQRVAVQVSSSGALSHESVLLQVSRASSVRVSTMQLAQNISCDACFQAFEDAGGCEALQRMDVDMLQELAVLPELAGCHEAECGESVQVGCVMQSAVTVQCNASCVSAFAAAGGCEALVNALVNASEMPVNEILALPSLASCNMNECEARLFEECFPPAEEEFCSDCVAQFDSAGGCEAPAEHSGEYVPEGCWNCGGEDALTHCLRKGQGQTDVEECGTCVGALGPPGNCASMFQGNASTALPSECAGISRACVQEAAAHCGQWSSEGCHTAERGEPCFPHTRWAMQSGIVAHPEWYPNLTQRSSFEEFQALLHERSSHDCPTPCMPLPETRCHTATSGEVCHHHTIWAMEAGAGILPTAYPASFINGSSSFEDFQGWLHHIHHGDCFAPCEHPEE